MSRTARSLLIAVAAGAALILVSLIGFVLWSRANSQIVIGSVNVSGMDLSGLERAEVEARLAELEAEQADTPIEIMVDDRSVTVSASDLGYRINTAELVDLALWQERTGSFVDRWRRWLRRLYSDPPPVQLHPRSAIDQTLVIGLLDNLDRQHGVPPVEGNVEFRDRRPVPTYPAPGWRLDTTGAVEKITAAALGGGGTVHLSLVLVTPRTGIEQVSEAMSKAQVWISAPVVLKDPKGRAELTFTAQEIADATTFGFDPSASPAVVLSIDPRTVTRKVAEVSSRVGDPPVDAYLEIDEDDQVIVHPSRAGTVIDVNGTRRLLEQLAAGEAREGTLPLTEGVTPRTTTEDIEMLRIRHLVSSYTTFHPCCQPRVTNIHLFADRVNDALVPPGEEFSLNGHVGRRTVEDGFVEDGTLLRGELVDTIGGGVSQFATTFYNAVYWGGFKDITHKTHSFYFSRYPEGIEATINWPEVDLVFLNDSDGHVLIRTEYTRTSITVKFFGDNDGRSVVGSWRDGRGRLEVVEGGAAARVVDSQVSGRFNEIEPPESLYRANSELAPGEVNEVQTAAPGWTVRVARTITQGADINEHIRNVRYIPRQEIIEVHPCVMSLLTDSGAVTPPEPSESDQTDPAAGEVEVVCPEPEDEEAEPTVLPEGLHERFPELVPEEEEQTPIEGDEGEQAPIEGDEDEQGPVEPEEGDQAPIEEEDGEEPPTDNEDPPTGPDEETPSDPGDDPAPSQGDNQ